MQTSEFIQWATEKGYVLGASSFGHTGRKDAWTKTYADPKEGPNHPALTVRYFLRERKGGTAIVKETSRGFGSFSRKYTKLLSRAYIQNGKLNWAAHSVVSTKLT